MKTLLRFLLFFFLILPLQAQVTPPHDTGFESSDGFTLGNLNGQNNWSVDQGTANVIDTDARSGTYSVKVEASSPFTQISLALNDPGGESIVLTDLYAKPYASDLSTKAEFLDVEGSIIGFYEVSSGVGEFYARSNTNSPFPTARK